MNQGENRVISETVQGIEPTRELKLLGRGGSDAWLRVVAQVKGIHADDPSAGAPRNVTLSRAGMVRLRDLLDHLLGDDNEGGES